MPANPKYLSQSKSQRFAKITAAILGGYLVSISFHLALASFFNQTNIIITMTFSAFILWVVLMILAFIAKNGWKIGLVYLLISAILFGLVHIANFAPINTTIWFLYPIYVLPQVVLGYLIVFLRLKHGFIYGLGLHILVNFIAVLMKI